MKKTERNLTLYGWLLFSLLLCPSLLPATTLSGTVNASYALGTYNITLAGQQGVYYTSNGSAFTQGFRGSLDNTASFSITVVGNDQIQPGGSQWKFTICNYGGGVCFTAQTTVTGSSQSVSTLLQSAAYPMPLTSTYMHFLGAPSGSCATTQQAEDDTTGLLYTCLSGSWNQSGGAVTWPLTSPSGATIASNSGDLEFTAGGTNQNITITPSGPSGFSPITATFQLDNGLSSHNLWGLSVNVPSNLPNYNNQDAAEFLSSGTQIGQILLNAYGTGLSIVSTGNLSLRTPNSSLTLGGCGSVNHFACFSQAYAGTGATPTDATSLNFDVSTANTFEVSLTANTTFTVSNPLAWTSVTFIWKQNATTAFTVTPPANFHGFTSPGVSLGAYNKQSCDFDGTNWICSVANINFP